MKVQATAPPWGGSTASAFVLTETQFRAEQAVLAGYEALTSSSYADKIENGKVTDPITISGIGTIGEGSFIGTTSTVRGRDIPVTMEIIFTPEDSSEAITVSITGSAANGETLEGFSADTYTATTGNETKEFNSTPSVFIAKNSNDEILDMINAYIDGSETGEFTVDEEASFINGNNPSWIVFTNPSIDSATHKVNFTPVDGTVSNFSLDDCLDVSEADVAISESPAYKPESLSMDEQAALKIGFEYLAYSIFGYDGQFGEFTENVFFTPGRKLNVTITEDETSDLRTIDITADGTQIHFVAADGSGEKLPDGYCTEFTIDDCDYSYLRDELYKRALALFCASSNLQDIFGLTYEADQDTVINNGNNNYIFNNAGDEYMSISGTATIPAENSPDFSTDIEIIMWNSAPIKLISSGTYTITYTEEAVTVDLEYSYINIPTHGGEATDFELDLINRCLYAITPQG